MLIHRYHSKESNIESHHYVRHTITIPLVHVNPNLPTSYLSVIVIVIVIVIADMDTITFPTTHQAVATTAGVPTTSVTGLTATQGRRLLAGVNMAYTIINLSAPILGSTGVNTMSTSSSSGGNCFMGSGNIYITSHHITFSLLLFTTCHITFIAVPPCVYFSIFSSLISFLPCFVDLFS